MAEIIFEQKKEEENKMKRKITILIIALLVLCVTAFCGCTVNINLPENEQNPEKPASSESSSSESSSSEKPAAGSEESSSGSESSGSGVVSPGKRPFNPETSGAAEENTQKTDSYEELIGTMKQSGAAFGEAFIGYIEGPMGTGYKEFFEERGYLEKYPFIADIPYERYVETSGKEMYCIVPKDKNSSVSVTEWKFSPTRGGSYGKVLYKSDSGEPILITCNEKENIPNVKVVIVDSDGKVFEFSPVYNSQLGWLEVYQTPEAYAYDFTVYNKSGSGGEILVFSDLLGDWAGIYTPDAKTEVLFHFTFYRGAYGEPCVNFWYMKNRTLIEYYEGYAYEQYDENGEFTGSLILEMTLTQGTNSAEKGPILLMSTYEFRRAEWDSGWIVTSCTGGIPLMEEFGLGWFEMEETMG
ncbi:MAG: hypothetical protein IJB66_06185 [Oscillospiraceae bacterium]|nr:hypothetical protein [Oscillospiraceae bacterium]